MRTRRLAGVTLSALIATAVAAPVASSAPATLVPVDLELVLAADNSQSVDRTEARLQREGVAAAFRHPDVVRAIQSGSLGHIAVAYLDWSSVPYTKLTLDWRVISDKASADAFADALMKAPPAFGRGTAIGEALLIAARMIETNNFQGTQRSIDVSGDGPNNTGPAVYEVRDMLVAQGITINGLPVVSTGDFGTGEWGIYYGELENYYANCVIGGPRSFVIPAKGFQEFAAAIRRKLVLEISDASPLPSPIIKVAGNPNMSRPPVPPRPPANTNRGGPEQCGGNGRGQRFRFGNF